ncbi:MAG: hypothetical protein ACFFB3_03090 [Candidatus Hodarchaeota archaeon]
MKTSGERTSFLTFFLKIGLIGFFAVFLLIDQSLNKSRTPEAFVGVLVDARLWFVCMILLPWNKMEKVARRTGQLKMAQAVAFAMIGILAIANIVILVSSSQAVIEHREIQDKLNQHRRRFDALGENYTRMIAADDLESELQERISLVGLFNWVQATIPAEYSWVLIAPNPSALDFIVYDPHYYNFSFFLMETEDGDSNIPVDAWPMLISSEVYNDSELNSILEDNLIATFPSKWTQTTDSLDLIVWMEGLDARPVLEPIEATRTVLFRAPLAWRVIEIEDNGNGVLDVSVSSSCLIVEEGAVKTLETEIAEITQLVMLDETIARDEQTLENQTPLSLIGALLLFMVVPGTIYYSWRTMRAIRDWKEIQQQYWGTLQRKLKSLQEGLVLEENKVNNYAWEDLEHFVDWNKPIIIRIADATYEQSLEAIYQSAPLGTAFIVQEGEAEDRFIKETGRFAIDFSQPLELENKNPLTTSSKDEPQVDDSGDI